MSDEDGATIGQFDVCHYYGNMFNFGVFATTTFIFLIIVGFIVQYMRKS